VSYSCISPAEWFQHILREFAGRKTAVSFLGRKTADLKHFILVGLLDFCLLVLQANALFCL